MAKQTVQLNYLRLAPRKVRAVADLVRGLSVNEAEAQLIFERRRPAKALLKLLRSAVQSAKTTKQLSPDELYIERCTVDQGPMLKRSLPRARGMATMIQKKMSHVTLTLAEKKDQSAARFRITVQKKIRLPEEEDSKKATKIKEVQSPGSAEATSKRKSSPGFFRKVFQRKSMGN